MLGLEREIGCLGKRCPVLIPTASGACPRAERAAAARKEDPSLPPLNLSTICHPCGGGHPWCITEPLSKVIQEGKRCRDSLMISFNQIHNKS